MDNYIIDLHCHPSLKPYGRSFPGRRQSEDPSKVSSLWYQDKETLWDKFKNFILGLTNFTQSDFTSAAAGNVKVVCVSLYPIEVDFTKLQLIKPDSTGFLADALFNLATGLGKKRIDNIQAQKDYFQDLEAEYDFFKQQNKIPQQFGGETFSYQLVKSYQEIEANLQNTNQNIISVMMSIEGVHVFNTGLDYKNNPANETEVMANIQKVKNWEYRPLFITLAHHFYNELCGHAISLEGIAKKVIQQREGHLNPIMPLGKKVIDALLDNTEGKRIHIDLKHMNAQSRLEYFEILEKEYAHENIPIIISHGACNGRNSYKDPFISEASPYARDFYKEDINFYDDEIIQVAKSNGIFGLQLDERRVANQDALQNTPKKWRRKKLLEYRSRLLWNQIQHIAQLLDRAGLPAWDHISLGTDFDGIIDPLNGFWSAEDLAFLDDYLLMHAERYFKGDEAYQGLMTQDANIISAEEVIVKVMNQNAQSFLKRHFHEVTPPMPTPDFS